MNRSTFQDVCLAHLEQEMCSLTNRKGDIGVKGGQGVLQKITSAHDMALVSSPLLSAVYKHTFVLQKRMPFSYLIVETFDYIYKGCL